MLRSMFGQVLCPVDLSSASRGAFETAIRLAKTSNAAVTALYVSPMTTPVIGNLPYVAESPPSLTREERARLESELEAFVASGRGTGVRVRVEVAEGSPGPEILHRAEVMHADLVAVGTHERSGISRFLLGSVAEEVLHGAPCPVVTVGHREPSELCNVPIRRIVCAESLRHPSRALEFALALAGFNGADLIVMHAIEELPRRCGAAKFPHARRLVELARMDMRATLDEGARRHCRVEELVLTGQPHEAIVECAREQAADVIILGVHDQHLPFMGSTVNRVVRAAGCPVLTVRGEVIRSLVKREEEVAAAVGS